MRAIALHLGNQHAQALQEKENNALVGTGITALAGFSGAIAPLPFSNSSLPSVGGTAVGLMLGAIASIYLIKG